MSIRPGSPRGAAVVAVALVALAARPAAVARTPRPAPPPPSPTPASAPAPAAAPASAQAPARAALTIPFLSPNERAEEMLVVRVAPLAAAANGGAGKVFAEKEVALPPGPKEARVAFEALAPGRWLVSWNGPGIAEEERAFAVGTTAVVAEVVTLKAGRTLRGSVRDDLGMVVEGASVQVGPGRESYVDSPLPDVSAVSGSDGTFALAGLPLEGTLSWSAAAKGHASEKGRLGGEARLEIVLARAQRVSGRVVDADGTPVAGAGIEPVYVEDGSGGGSRSQHRQEDRILADALGRFAFHRPYHFPGRLFVRSAGFLSQSVPLEEVVAGGPRELDLGDIALERGRTVTGRVRAVADRRPVVGARVVATWTTGAEESRAIDGTDAESDGDGAFELTGLPREGAVRLVASAPSFAKSSSDLDADADSVELLLGKGGRVEGEVCGTAAELARSTVRYGSGGEPASGANEVPLGPGGRFVVENAETGRWQFARAWTFRDASGAFRSGVLGVASAEESAVVEEGATARVRLACDGILVTGTLKANGAALGNRVLNLTIANRAFAEGFVDGGTGAFAMRVPSPGRWSAWGLAPPGGMSFVAPSCDVPPEGLAGCALDLTPAPAAK